MADFQPPPTWAEVLLLDEKTKKPVFNPVWLKWFLDLTAGVGPTGAGSVTSVAETFTGGLISVAGSPITTSGTLALTVAGTSGGIVYFSGAAAWASSGLLAAQAILLGGGAGAAPTGLTLGTAHQVPEVNSGATAVQYTSWPTIKRTVDAAQTLTIDSGFSLVVGLDFTNEGTVTNNGVMVVV